MKQQNITKENTLENQFVKNTDSDQLIVNISGTISRMKRAMTRKSVRESILIRQVKKNHFIRLH